jgi:hypothetical protein
MTVRVLLVLLVGLTAVLAIGMKPSNSSTTSGMRNLFRRKKTKVIVTETLLDPEYKTKGEKVIDAVVHFFQDPNLQHTMNKYNIITTTVDGTKRETWTRKDKDTLGVYRNDFYVDEDIIHAVILVMPNGNIKILEIGKNYGSW